MTLRTVQSNDAVSLRSRTSDEEWQIRVDLAAAYQLAVLFGWTDIILTHFSARVPGNEDHFLLNAYGLAFDEVTASNLVKVDHEGRIIEDITGLGVNQAGFVIHGCVHQARHEARCVLHTHTRAGIAVSAMKEGLLPISQQSVRLARDVTYHDYEGIALYMEERVRLAADLGPKSNAMILRNHGLLTLGATVRDAFKTMYNLEMACKIQVDALGAGRENLVLIPDAVLDKENSRPPMVTTTVPRDWPALLRMLERRKIDYKS